jgi:hypothetical protein
MLQGKGGTGEIEGRPAHIPLGNFLKTFVSKKFNKIQA